MVKYKALEKEFGNKYKSFKVVKIPQVDNEEADFLSNLALAWCVNVETSPPWVSSPQEHK